MNGVNKKEEPSPFSLHRNISANKFIARKFTANDKYSFWQKRREEKKEKKGKEKEEDSSIEATTQKERKKGRIFLSRTNYLKITRYIILDARLNCPNPWNTWLEIAWNAEIG